MRNLREGGSKSMVREVAVGEKWYHQTMHLVEDAQRVRVYGVDITPASGRRRRCKFLKSVLPPSF